MTHSETCCLLAKKKIQMLTGKCEYICAHTCTSQMHMEIHFYIRHVYIKMKTTQNTWVHVPSPHYHIFAVLKVIDSKSIWKMLYLLKAGWVHHVLMLIPACT